MGSTIGLRPETLKHAIEAADDGIYIADPAGTILFANRAILEITGYGEDEFVGQRTSIFRSGEMSDAYYRRLWNTVSSGRVWREIIINRRKSGEHYEASQTITPVLDGDGDIEVFIAVQRELTRQRELESELREAQTEIERLLTEKETQLGEAYHRTKNDLFLLESLFRVHASEASSGDARATLEEAAGRASALGRMYSLLESHSESVPGRLPLDHLLRELVQGLAATQLPATARVSLQCESVLVDSRVATTVSLVTYELVLNAVKYALGETARPVLEIRASAPDAATLELTVHDTGPGLPDDVVNGERTGSGLRTVSLLARQYGGTLIARNERGAVVGLRIRTDR